jgi:hypothetical protein
MTRRKGDRTSHLANGRVGTEALDEVEHVDLGGTVLDTTFGEAIFRGTGQWSVR